MGSSFDTEAETPEFENLAKLAENMVFRLPGCADVTVRKFLSSAYRDFCKRTCVLKSRRQIEIVEGKCSYSVTARIPDCIVDCVIGVAMNGRELEACRYTFEGRNIVIDGRIAPRSDEKAFLDVCCVEIPKISSECVPAGFIDRYGDAIVNGAMCKLLAMAGKPWSDMGQSAFCGSEYENAITEERARHHAGGGLSAGRLNYIKHGCVL